MPHIVIEHSARLREQVDLPAFLAEVHQAALATGIFPIGGIRAYAAENYAIADGHPDNALVHIPVGVADSGACRDRTKRNRAAGLQRSISSDTAPSMNPESLAFDHVAAIPPYPPGRPISSVAREYGLEPSSIVKLASNENPLGLSPRAGQAIENGGVRGPRAGYGGGVRH